MAKPDESEYASFYKGYVELIKAIGAADALEEDFARNMQLLNGITEETALHRYAEGKWSIKEIMQHVLDSERVFAYRALCFARNDKTPLPGFDQDSYVAATPADLRPWNQILEEFLLVRESNMLMFDSFSESQLRLTGTANDSKVSVRAIGFIMAGHFKHHVNVIKERYLS